MVREEDAAALVVVAHQGLAVLGYNPVITSENSVWLMRYAGLMLAGFGITGRETTEENDGFANDRRTMMAEREPDWDREAELEAESRRDAQFGGHDFRYESSTDLFRCAACRGYEVALREEEGGIKPCPGPVSGDPMALNVF